MKSLELSKYAAPAMFVQVEHYPNLQKEQTLRKNAVVSPRLFPMSGKRRFK